MDRTRFLWRALRVSAPLRFPSPGTRLGGATNSPDLVVEVVSKEVNSEDRDKLARYARIGVPYYVIYDPFAYLGDRPLRAYEHHATRYVEIVNPRVLPELGLSLNIWEGVYYNAPARYLRLGDASGNLLLTGEEQRQRGDAERQRADAERRRAEVAEAELEELRRKLQG